MTDDEAENLAELAAAQIESQGAACVRVEDGHVFIFTRALLEELLAKAIESGEDKAILFVRSGAVA